MTCDDSGQADQATGRFLTRDPLPLVQRYPYVGNNPANYVDPYGLFGIGIPGTDIGIDVPCPGCDEIKDTVQCLARSDYRCAAAEGVSLLPSGQFTIPFVGTTVTFQEGGLCLIYPEQCLVVNRLASNANSETVRRYGQLGPENSPADAFQHCFWSGSITLIFGAEGAGRWTDAHEAVAGNTDDEREFDQANNARGRAFGESLRPWGFANPFGFSELGDRCYE